jgi:hypothetical protein
LSASRLAGLGSPDLPADRVARGFVFHPGVLDGDEQTDAAIVAVANQCSKDRIEIDAQQPVRFVNPAGLEV